MNPKCLPKWPQTTDDARTMQPKKRLCSTLGPKMDQGLILEVKMLTFGPPMAPFLVQNARVKDSDMSTAQVFEEKENAATSHCFSDLSEMRLLTSLGSFEELSSNLDRKKKGTPNVKKKNRESSPCSISSVWCGS